MKFIISAALVEVGVSFIISDALSNDACPDGEIPMAAEGGQVVVCMPNPDPKPMPNPDPCGPDKIPMKPQGGGSVVCMEKEDVNDASAAPTPVATTTGLGRATTAAPTPVATTDSCIIEEVAHALRNLNPALQKNPTEAKNVATDMCNDQQYPHIWKAALGAEAHAANQTKSGCKTNSLGCCVCWDTEFSGWNNPNCWDTETKTVKQEEMNAAFECNSYHKYVYNWCFNYPHSSRACHDASLQGVAGGEAYSIWDKGMVDQHSEPQPIPFAREHCSEDAGFFCRY